MQIGDTLDTRLLPSHTLGERIPCCMEETGERILCQDYGANGKKRKKRKRPQKRKETRLDTYQNKLCPHGMRAALISPSKQTIQSRLEREVLVGLEGPLRLPKDVRDSVGELEVVVEPPFPGAEKGPKMVPLAEEKAEEEIWSAALSRRPRESTSASTGHPFAEEEEEEEEEEVSSAEFLRSLVDPKTR